MKIIIVERDESIAHLYKEEFNEFGHEVISLCRGEKLLKIIQKENPQVLILGVRIPGYRYFDLLEQVKTVYPKLPVIFNTSLSELWEEAKQRGADYYSPKTADLTGLIEILKAIEERNQP